MVAPALTWLNCPQGEFELQRYPSRNREPLRAWCAADVLLLEAAKTSSVNTLVVNDDHGALSLPLSASAMWTDSALAAEALAQNSSLNDLPSPKVIWSTQLPRLPVDRIVLRIPKQLPYFEFQLAQLATVMPAGTQLLCAGMDKHLSPHTAALMEQQLGPVERHRGRQKARLFSATLPGEAKGPSPSEASYHCDLIDQKLTGLANVFSREKLDPGSRLMLETLRRAEPVASVADLACGNGLLGIAALHFNLASSVLFADESAMAIASARANAARAARHDSEAAFHLGDGLQGIERKFDLIVCNPPFHLGHTVDDFAGRRLLQQAAHSLLPGGSLLLVANRHLDYAPSLKRLFRHAEVMAQNAKFVVWRARHS
ncbi:MAG: methyltransferase [Halioglobus sp.]|nr:methyltransferase [Halioglobus sp.]MDG2327797.1 methyltransferase [Halioglobus sp.]